MFTLEPWRLGRPELAAAKNQPRALTKRPHPMRRAVHHLRVRLVWEWRSIRERAANLLNRRPTARPMS